MGNTKLNHIQLIDELMKIARKRKLHTVNLLLDLEKEIETADETVERMLHNIHLTSSK